MKEIVQGLHFYDPPRHTYHEQLSHISTDPNRVNWLPVVYERCYQPLMKSRVLEKVSYDINAVLLQEMKRQGLDVSGFINKKLAANVVGTSYIHPILPDLNNDDKRIVIGAGFRRYQQYFGVDPKIFWSPEAAIDLNTLGILTEFGYQAFVCAPWQIQTVDGSSPDNRIFRIKLPRNREIAAIVYDAELSSLFAFGDKSNADRFFNNSIAPKLQGHDLVVVWTDGETFGHHAPFADKFLEHLHSTTLPNEKINSKPINELEVMRTQLPFARLLERTSWSCHCGDLKRWHTSCECAGGANVAWKEPFYETFRWLNQAIGKIAREKIINYVEVLTENFESAFVNPGSIDTNPLRSLCSAYVDALTARTSCGTFFNDPHTSGRINILFGVEAIQHLRDAGLSQIADNIEGEYLRRLSAINDPTHPGRNLLNVLEEMLRQ